MIVIVKLRQVRAAFRWPAVSGLIVSGETEAAPVTTKFGTENAERDITEIRNFAKIRYRYPVDGRQYTGSRVSVGEDTGNDEVAARVKRYPKGRAITVYYDPADPSKAVLGRDLPQGCARAGLIGLAILAAIVGIFGFGLDYAVAFVTPHIQPGADASAVIFAATFSTLTALFALIFWNQGHTARK